MKHKHGWIQSKWCTTKDHITCHFCLKTYDLQEIDTASPRWWGDPDKAEARRGLVADVGSHHTADKLGSTKLTIWHHTCGTEDKQDTWGDMRTSSEGSSDGFVFFLNCFLSACNLKAAKIAAVFYGWIISCFIGTSWFPFVFPAVLKLSLSTHENRKRNLQSHKCHVCFYVGKIDIASIS